MRLILVGQCVDLIVSGDPPTTALLCTVLCKLVVHIIMRKSEINWQWLSRVQSGYIGCLEQRQAVITVASTSSVESVSAKLTTCKGLYIIYIYRRTEDNDACIIILHCNLCMLTF